MSCSFVGVGTHFNPTREGDDTPHSLMRWVSGLLVHVSPFARLDTLEGVLIMRVCSFIVVYMMNGFYAPVHINGKILQEHPEYFFDPK